MGYNIEPGNLTDSGERCLRRIAELQRLNLPASHFALVAMAPVEVHVTRVIDRLITLSPESTARFGKTLIQHVGDSFHNSWDLRIKWLCDGFGLAISDKSPYRRLKLVVEVRNAIAHGDGQLTRRQTGRVTKLKALRQDLKKDLDVECRGLVLEPTSSSVDKTVTAIRAFVADFDAKVMSEFPDSRNRSWPR